MSRVSISVKGISKRYRLGQTHVYTLSDRVAGLARRLVGRSAPDGVKAEDFWALRDVNLAISEGEAVGIVGGNGAGKSTLLKILSRITHPTTGTATVRGRMSSLLEVGTGFHPELTGRENVFLNGTILGMRRQEVARKFDEIVAFSGVEKFIDTPVKRYSSGMYVRLAFAVAAHLEPDVLIIDEVLAVGDADFQRRCLGKMGDVTREGRTVLFVSHNMAAIQKLCSRAVLMKDGVVAYQGDVRSCIDEYLGASCTTDAIREFERADPRFSLVRATLSGRESRPKADFSFDQSIVLELGYEYAEAVAHLSIGIRIRTAGGCAVFSSERPVEDLGPLKAGSGRCRVEIPGHLLTPGRFMVTIGVHVPSVEVLFLEENAMSFTVHETGSSLALYESRDIGCVIVDCAWRDEPFEGSDADHAR